MPLLWVPWLELRDCMVRALRPTPTPSIRPTERGVGIGMDRDPPGDEAWEVEPYSKLLRPKDLLRSKDSGEISQWMHTRGC